MSHGPVPSGSATLPGISYARGLRRAYYAAALVIAVLPIPVVLLQLVPTYRIHTPFLVFFGPLVCLLTLAYLFYIRDTLARLMFGHLLDSEPPDGYYPDDRELRQRHIWFTLRTTLVALLPALLIVMSFLLVMRYTDRLNESLAVASVSLIGPEDVGVIKPVEKPTDPGRPSRFSRSSRSLTSTPDSTSLPEVGRAVRSETRRRQVLQSAPEVPDFRALTVLYISPFLSALAALVLMGLREYAREALGLSERDVVLGRALARPEVD